MAANPADNTAPVFFAATKDYYFRRMTTWEGNPVTVRWYATDAENNILTYSIVTQPINGTAVIDGDGNLTFTPSASGTGMVTICATDVYGAATNLTIQINVGKKVPCALPPWATASPMAWAPTPPSNPTPCSCRP